MNLKGFASTLYSGCCLFVLFVVVAAASFNGFYGKWKFREAGTSGFMQTANFDAIVDGTAARPYVYRQLLPMLGNWIDHQVPEPLKDRLFSAKNSRGVLLREILFSTPISQSRAYFLRYLIIYILDYLFAFISVYAMYLLCRTVGYAPATSALSSATMILLLPYFMTLGGFLWDYPELAFLALAAWMALNFDWWWMIPLAALATFNKESFLFFIPALYPLIRKRNSRINTLIGTGALGLTCAAVGYVLRWRYRNNPGGTVEFHLLGQISYLSHMQNMLHMEKTYGIYMIPISNPLPVALIAWTIWRGWRYLPQEIKRHAQIAAVINIPLYLLFCYPGEFRDLSLLYISFLLLMAANLAQWDGNHSTAATPLSAQNCRPG